MAGVKYWNWRRASETALKWRWFKLSSFVNPPGQSKVLLTIDICDTRSGRSRFMGINLLTGQLTKMFSLPNVQVGDLTRFITSAAFSPDGTKIAYVTNLSFLPEERTDKFEVWEYDLVKDIHTLLVQLPGTVMGELEIVGYQNNLSNLIIYQYIADGVGYYVGQVKFIDLVTKEVSSEVFQAALDFTLIKQRLTMLHQDFRRPYLAPTKRFGIRCSRNIRRRAKRFYRTWFYTIENS
jgi:hypothetical protein